MRTILKRLAKNGWPAAAILLGTSWLYAPYLNHNLAATTTLISEYESIGQPWSWLIRICDILSAAIIGLVIIYLLKKHRINKRLGIFLGIYTIGALFDGVLTFTCISLNRTCSIPYSLGSVAHAIESTITASALFLAIILHYKQTRKHSSLIYLWLQVLYGLTIVITLLTNTIGHRTISQFTYQIIVLLWVVNLLRTYIGKSRGLRFARRAIASLVILNGIGAIVLSVLDLPGFGIFKGLYFGNGTAWLAQHTILTGLLLVYLGRHIYRGEANARL